MKNTYIAPFFKSFKSLILLYSVGNLKQYIASCHHVMSTSTVSTLVIKLRNKLCKP